MIFTRITYRVAKRSTNEMNDIEIIRSKKVYVKSIIIYYVIPCRVRYCRFCVWAATYYTSICMKRHKKYSECTTVIKNFNIREW